MNEDNDDAITKLMKLLGFLRNLIVVSLIIYFIYWFFKSPGKLFWRWMILPIMVVFFYVEKLKYADSHMLYERHHSEAEFKIVIAFTILVATIVIIGKFISAYMSKQEKIETE